VVGMHFNEHTESYTLKWKQHVDPFFKQFTVLGTFLINTVLTYAISVLTFFKANILV
jgi:hypothetical protein